MNPPSIQGTTIPVDSKAMKVQFARINFLLETVQRFRIFSKRHERTHSEVLDGMMDFFDKYQLSPFQEFGANLHGMEANIKKRINSMIAIIKEIEKNQTKPTTAMLELLFEKSPQKRTGPAPKAIGQQRADPQREAFIKKIEAAIEMERENTDLKIELKKNRTDMIGLLGKIRLIKSNFGRPRLEMDMDLKEFEALKTKIKKG